MTIEERALNYTREGWGSRASVFMALLDHFRSPLPLEIRKWICLALDPFHGPSGSFYTEKGKYGITVCGALSGALAAFNVILADPEMLPYAFWTEGMKEDGWIKRMLDENWETKRKIEKYIQMLERYGYGAHHEMIKRFYNKFSTTDCYDLCKPFKDPVSVECFRNCARIICWTASMAKDVIEEFKVNPEKFKIGDEHCFKKLMRDINP
ncbi:hypothetical protein TST_1018 [Thermosulfidibacter takaii ABI70S6]|uniref:C_GCAxxG_C_C family protein n=1 Tax=Thermosulfidibacter takaii (strain DSM 17441 / JCM 13301 / NBRC 103674 / ABI70S6) TaxID=1298851 RepID=A0A0S3QU05_THET7|nr:C-GCAxxG-C-C family protein [Thermosulfidibacter takaii]BAT71812.1 hypothetical protein TST_1018 [Thermosulfidibacter takaii ABI70S6]